MRKQHEANKQEELLRIQQEAREQEALKLQQEEMFAAPAESPKEVEVNPRLNTKYSFSVK
ncbi:hypothetical protein ECANGB1_2154 [Enterospora canceri]|uniref:Uncharacterized protein n=1 Tax=Enterospora canceri TaxID=1081671 RepID=A0A1Y1S3S6_9MICR|nr:hypothetical protein ECANGB1_2154 [Enterospora canceri]